MMSLSRCQNHYPMMKLSWNVIGYKKKKNPEVQTVTESANFLKCTKIALKQLSNEVPKVTEAALSGRALLVFKNILLIDSTSLQAVQLVGHSHTG